MSLSNFVKRIRNIMRNDAGINGDAQRIEQMAWMLFLKVYDEKENDWELDDDDYKSIIPEECRWRNWAHDDGSGNGIDHLAGDHQLSSRQAQRRKCNNGGKVLGAGAPDQLRCILQEVADTDGGDQHRETRNAPQGLVGQSLDQHAQKRTHDDGRQNTHRRGKSQIARYAVGHISAHHDHVAVGEVQHFGDTVDHGVAQRDQRVDAPQAQPAYQCLYQIRHSRHSFAWRPFRPPGAAPGGRMGLL